MKKVSPAIVGALLIGVAIGAKVLTTAEAQQARYEPVRVIENVDTDIDAVDTTEVSDVSPEGNVEDQAIDPDELSEREKALSEREDLLKAYEAKISLKVDELKLLSAELERVKEEIVVRQTEDTRKLAFMYSNMKARDAADIMAKMPVDTVVAIIDGMTDVQAAALMGALDPDLANRVTNTILLRENTR